MTKTRNFPLLTLLTFTMPQCWLLVAAEPRPNIVFILGDDLGYDDAIRLRETNDLGLPAEEQTIVRLLKQAGYSTAITGKWHVLTPDSNSRRNE